MNGQPHHPAKERELQPGAMPPPRGGGTEILGFLTSVGELERDKGRPTSIDRLSMRLRIFWFSVVAVPILVGAGVVATTAGMLAELDAKLAPRDPGRPQDA